MLLLSPDHPQWDTAQQQMIDNSIDALTVDSTGSNSDDSSMEGVGVKPDVFSMPANPDLVATDTGQSDAGQTEAPSVDAGTLYGAGQTNAGDITQTPTNAQDFVSKVSGVKPSDSVLGTIQNQIEAASNRNYALGTQVFNPKQVADMILNKGSGDIEAPSFGKGTNFEDEARNFHPEPGTFESGEPPRPENYDPLEDSRSQLQSLMRGNPRLIQFLKDHNISIDFRPGGDTRGLNKANALLGSGAVPDYILDSSKDVPKFSQAYKEALTQRMQSNPDFRNAIYKLNITNPSDLTDENLARVDALAKTGAFGDTSPVGARPVFSETGEESMTGVPQSVRDQWLVEDSQPAAGQPGSVYNNEFARGETEGGKVDTAQPTLVDSNTGTVTPGYENVPQYTTAPGDMVPSTERTPQQQLEDLKARQQLGAQSAAAKRAGGIQAQQAVESQAASDAKSAFLDTIRNKDLNDQDVSERLGAPDNVQASVDPTDGSVEIKPMAGGAPGGSQKAVAGPTIATWVDSQPGVTGKVKAAAKSVTDFTGKLVQPYFEAGPEVENLARTMGGRYEGAATEGSIALNNGPDTATIAAHPGDSKAAWDDWQAKVSQQVYSKQTQAVQDFVNGLEQSGHLARLDSLGVGPDPTTGALPEGWVKVSDSYAADPMTAAGLKHTFGPHLDLFSEFADRDPTPDDVNRLFGKDGEAWQRGVQKVLDGVSALKETKLGLSLFHGPTTAVQAGRLMTDVGHPVQAVRNVGTAIRYTVGGPAQYLKDHPGEEAGWQQASNTGLTGLSFRRLGGGGYGAAFDVGDERGSWDTAARAISNAVVGAAAGYGTGWGLGKAEGLSDDERNAQAAKYAAIGGLAAGAGNLFIRKGIFQSYMPVLKYTTWKTLTEAGMDGRAAADAVNNATGGQNLIAMGRSPQFQRFLRTAMLAPDFDEGLGARMPLNALSKNPELRGASQKWLANLALTFIGAQVMQSAVNQLSDDPDVQNKHFTWDNGARHLLQVDVSPLVDKAGWNRTWADTNGRVGKHAVYAGIPWMGPVGSSVSSVAKSGLGAVGDVMSNHLGIIPDMALQGIQSRGTQNMDPAQAGGQMAADIASSFAPIGTQQFVEEAKQGRLGENLPQEGAQFAASQITGSRITPGRAEGDFIRESARLGVGGAAGAPSTFRLNDVANTSLTQSAARRLGVPPLPIALTADEVKWANHRMYELTENTLKQYRDQYDALPDTGMSMQNELRLRPGARGGVATFQADNKAAMLSQIQDLAHQQVMQELVSGRMSKNEYMARVAAAQKIQQDNMRKNAGVASGRF